MSELTASPPAASARRTRLVLALAALAAAAVATGFGAYSLTRDEPTHVASIGCYSEASTRADAAVIGNTSADPVAACAELWRRGHVRQGVTTAPALEACVLETGAVAVVPGTGASVCHATGAARLSREGQLELRRLGGVQAALVTRLTGACVGEARARALAEGELAARGLSGWTVESAGAFGADRPCASVTLDRTRRVVLLVPASG